MDNIEDIYTNDIYYPFILYCKAHKYCTMLDLRKCQFDILSKENGMTAGLLMRIKSVYAAYYKKHPDLLMGKNIQKKIQKSATPAPVIEDQLKGYFESHKDALVRVNDVCKELSLNRNVVAKVLETSNWCKSVDSGTFFYLPM